MKNLKFYFAFLAVLASESTYSCFTSAQECCEYIAGCYCCYGSLWADEQKAKKIDKVYEEAAQENKKIKDAIKMRYSMHATTTIDDGCIAPSNSPNDIPDIGFSWFGSAIHPDTPDTKTFIAPPNSPKSRELPSRFYPMRSNSNNSSLREHSFRSGNSDSPAESHKSKNFDDKDSDDQGSWGNMRGIGLNFDLCSQDSKSESKNSVNKMLRASSFDSDKSNSQAVHHGSKYCDDDDFLQDMPTSRVDADIQHSYIPHVILDSHQK